MSARPVVQNLAAARQETSGPGYEPPQGGPWIRLFERDSTYPLDSEGTPTADGSIWFVAPSAVAAVRVEPESSRGERTYVYLHGSPKPILICEDARGLLRKLQGLPQVQAHLCVLCHRDIGPAPSISPHGALCDSCFGRASYSDDELEIIWDSADPLDPAQPWPPEEA